MIWKDLWSLKFWTWNIEELNTWHIYKKYCIVVNIFTGNNLVSKAKTDRTIEISKPTTNIGGDFNIFLSEFDTKRKQEINTVSMLLLIYKFIPSKEREKYSFPAHMWYL